MMTFILKIVLCVTGLALASASGAFATSSYMWSRSAGGGHNLHDNAAAIASDAAGNVHLCGDFFGAASFGGDSLIADYYIFGNIHTYERDMVIAKYDKNNHHQWSQNRGGDNHDFATGMALDASGNMITAGSFLAPTNLGGATLSSGSLYLAKYNSAGAHVWSLSTGVSGGGSSQAWITSVACDAAGNVFIGGYFQGTMNIAGTNFVSLGSYDAYVAKYTAAGSVAWVSRFGTSDVESIEDLQIDNAGNVLITGRYFLSISFGGAALPDGGGYDPFLVKLNNNGGHVWSKGFANSLDGLGHAVSRDDVGNVVLAGSFGGTINFGGSTLSAPGVSEYLYLARFDANGNHIWSQSFASEGGAQIKNLAVDTAGNIAATGFFGYIFDSIGYTINLAGVVLASAGEADGFVASFSSAGATRWASRFGGAGLDSGEDVAVDPSGNVLICGTFEQSFKLLADSHTSRGWKDMFWAKFAFADAEPVITSIVDVGNDQGREVQIRFDSSGLDIAGCNYPVIRYDAYRRNDPLPLAGARGAAPAVDWQYVSSVPAHAKSTYLMRASTLADYTVEDGQHLTTFLVRAVTSDVHSFYDTPSVTGYSLDNLSPGVPENLVYAGGQLAWAPSDAEDFAFFTVYGAEQNDFASAVVVDQTTQPALDVSESPYAFYFVTAFDKAGNESDAASTGGSDGGNNARRYILSVANYPNPFNPATTVSYTVPSRGVVTVKVYDSRGALVATLVEKSHEAGAYSIDWNGRASDGTTVASGVYFARIAHNGASYSKKMVLLK